MTFDEMAGAVSQAEITLRIADNLSGRLARLLVGRLRKVGSGYVLSQLKDELRKFNNHTKSWND